MHNYVTTLNSCLQAIGRQKKLAAPTDFFFLSLFLLLWCLQYCGYALPDRCLIVVETPGHDPNIHTLHVDYTNVDNR